MITYIIVDDEPIAHQRKNPAIVRGSFSCEIMCLILLIVPGELGEFVPRVLEGLLA